MTDQRLGHLVGEWLRESCVPTSDPHEGVRNVIAQTSDMSQVGTGWRSRLTVKQAVPVPIPKTNGRTRTRGLTVFSALKFIAAAVIVALFGGFLLTGILSTPQGDDVLPATLTESPSPMTTEELLSGMVTEEVEPGVFRVVHDGVRDLPVTLDADGDVFPPTEAIRVSPEGGLWVFGGHWDDAVFRLGEPGGYPWPEGTPLDLLDLVDRPDDVEVAPDGTVWMADAGTASVYSLDGTEWTTWPLPRSHDLNIEVLADGTVWASPSLRLGDEGWERVESPGCSLYEMQASDTDIYVDGGPGGSTDCDGTLYRFDGTDWQEVDTPDGYLSRGGFYGASPVGADGTLWVDYRRGPEAELSEGNGRRGIARFDGTRWEEWDIHTFDGEALTSKGHPFIDHFNFEAVAPDGSLWGSVDECDGIGHFDGTTVTRYLARHCIYSPDVAPDGSLWLVAAEGTSIYDPTGSPGLYVIRP